MANQRVEMFSQGASHASTLKHLPSYEEINVPYSLRLPAYRASYMRRFHPYARYSAPLETYPTDHDDELLDLSILEEPVPQPAAEAADEANEVVHERQEAAAEGGDEAVEVNAEPENDVVEQEGGRSGFFLRLDAAAVLERLQLELKD